MGDDLEHLFLVAGSSAGDLGGGECALFRANRTSCTAKSSSTVSSSQLSSHAAISSSEDTEEPAAVVNEARAAVTR